MIKHSLIIITFRRDDALRDNLSDLAGKVGTRDDLELILVDNNEDDIDRAHLGANFKHFVSYKPGVNRGVAGGRNDGIDNASGDILIFLDDDAFFTTSDFPNRIAKLFCDEPCVGILAFRSTNYYSRQMDRAEFPHTNKNLDPEKKFKTFRYIGVGHAIRREVFKKVGLYNADFFYGMEEFDFSYRAIKAGYQIMYAPEICVVHKKNPSGRMPAVSMIEQTLLNKLRVNHEHIPQPYALVSNILWVAFSFFRSRGRISLLSVWRKYRHWTTSGDHRRQPLSGAARQYVLECGARLWT